MLEHNFGILGHAVLALVAFGAMTFALLGNVTTKDAHGNVVEESRISNIYHHSIDAYHDRYYTKTAQNDNKSLR